MLEIFLLLGTSRKQKEKLPSEWLGVLDVLVLLINQLKSPQQIDDGVLVAPAETLILAGDS